MDFIKGLQDQVGGDAVEQLKDKAGDLLDQIPGGIGDKIGDALGIETAADRAVVETAEGDAPAAEEPTSEEA